LFTLVGPAGVGKNRLIQSVQERTPVRQLPTATTRPIRPGEQEGREHLFVSDAEFRRMLAAGELLEHEVTHGNLYGMPRAAVEAALDSGKAIIADIGIQGDERATAAYPGNVISIFIEPPSIGSLIERMRDRREREAEIGKRLLRVPRELAYAPRCSYAILNDRLDDAAAKLYEIVSSELSGERSTCCDEVLDYRFRYAARIIPIYRDQALYCENQPDAPEESFGDGELPHRAALLALRRALAIDAEADALIGGDKPNGEYLPPVRLVYAQDAAGEHITYVYLYRLDTHVDAPAGWRWVDLPEEYASVVLERRSEA
jgi:guanylate kinase